MIPTILVTDNVPGNLHSAAKLINDRGLAEYVVVMDHSGGYTVVVYRMPVEAVEAAKARGVIPKGA